MLCELVLEIAVEHVAETLTVCGGRTEGENDQLIVLDIVDSNDSDDDAVCEKVAVDERVPLWTNDNEGVGERVGV